MQVWGIVLSKTMLSKWLCSEGEGGSCARMTKFQGVSVTEQTNIAVTSRGYHLRATFVLRTCLRT